MHSCMNNFYCPPAVSLIRQMINEFLIHDGFHVCQNHILEVRQYGVLNVLFMLLEKHLKVNFIMSLPISTIGTALSLLTEIIEMPGCTVTMVNT